MKTVLFVLIILFCSCKTEQKVPSTDSEIYMDILKKNPQLSHEEIEDIMFKGE